jgi:hypothetical protein
VRSDRIGWNALMVGAGMLLLPPPPAAADVACGELQANLHGSYRLREQVEIGDYPDAEGRRIPGGTALVDVMVFFRRVDAGLPVFRVTHARPEASECQSGQRIVSDGRRYCGEYPGLGLPGTETYLLAIPRPGQHGCRIAWYDPTANDFEFSRVLGRSRTGDLTLGGDFEGEVGLRLLKLR